jgi:hypothetical protein
MAHVALPNDSKSFGELRNVVRALENAIATPDALIIEVSHDPRVRILLISENGTAVKTCRISAVVARRSNGLAERLASPRTDEQPDVAPRLIIIKSVQRVAGSDARFAASTGIEIHLESILLTGAGGGEGN